jgi:hypothetical protein
MARHVSYANVTATLALIIATSGVSYAAVAVPRNSVGSRQLKDNAVTSRKIRGGAVGVTDLARSVRARLDAAGRQGAPGAPGAMGPQGPPGAKGDKGDRGLNSAASRQVPNMDNIACGQDVVVGSLPVNVTEPSRVWTDAHGAIDNATSGNTEAALCGRARRHPPG